MGGYARQVLAVRGANWALPAVQWQLYECGSELPTEQVTDLSFATAGELHLQHERIAALADVVDVKARLEEFGAIEAEIVRGLANTPTMHG